MARILVIASFTPSLILFRKDMLCEMKAAGHEVTACSPDPTPDVVAELARLGIAHIAFPLQRTGMNPLADWGTYKALRRIIRQYGPDHVFSYTIKPVVYGCLAAGSENVPHIHAMITGLGTAFQKTGLTGKLLNFVSRTLYRKALAKAQTVLFQNPDDRKTFIDLRLAAGDKMVLINGSGINTDDFPQQPLPGGPTVFLLIARLLREKGVREFAAAARQLRTEGRHCRSLVVGYFDEHPQAISRDEMEHWVAEGSLEYAGELADVRPALANCTVYCLPSYREGLPRTVLEAMATGRAIVTTDAPGCRETVVPGENGMLVPVGDSVALAQAMTAYLDDPELAQRHGDRSRELAVSRFEVRAVNQAIFEGIKLA